jgi:hypothetical protein
MRYSTKLKLTIIAVLIFGIGSMIANQYWQRSRERSNRPWDYPSA